MSKNRETIWEFNHVWWYVSKLMLDLFDKYYKEQTKIFPKSLNYLKHESNDMHSNYYVSERILFILVFFH